MTQQTDNLLDKQFHQFHLYNDLLSTEKIIIIHFILQHQLMGFEKFKKTHCMMMIFIKVNVKIQSN